VMMGVDEMSGRCRFGGMTFIAAVWGFAFGLLVAVSNVVVVVDGYPNEDLVVNLPGQPKVAFRQFAGYIDVDAQKGRSLFYYFVEAEKDPANKPLALWLNGGKFVSLSLFTPPPLTKCPGCSSVGGGAFTELGPFFPRGDGRALRKNSMAWNRASNLLFVDSPAGVGWSYSNATDDYTTGDANTARDMITFLLNWYEKFPELKSTALFLTGESYAGHYIPQLANVLLDHNINSDFKFNIKGVAIGNPLLKLDRDVPSTYEFFWSHGMISDEVGLAIMNECDFDDYTYTSPHNVSESCNKAISEAGRIVGDYINNYDVVLDVCYPSIVEQELRLKKMATKLSMGVDVCMTYERHYYFNLPEVQKALHANRTNLPYAWSMCSDVLNYSDTDGNIDILPILKRIIENHIPVWVFSGDQDSVVPLLGSRTLVRDLAHELGLGMSVPYGAWFHKGQVGGWATEYGNMLTFATVRGAAHMVPYSQPSRALHLFSSFVRGRRLPNTTRIPMDG
ncbi:Serine carboxypeptidase-like 42, partial [Turnera subulata]